MSAITHLFAGIPVSDLAASIDWYTRFFGRPPDSRVGQEILWEIDEHAWLFIEPNAAQAGAGRITLSVVGLDALLERLAAQRIEHEPIDTYSNGVRHVNVPDPDGNTIAFAEPPDAASASPGSAGTEDSSNPETRTATAGPSSRSRPAARKDRRENVSMPEKEAEAAPATKATTSSGPLTGPGAAAGPLVVSETNPRYFAVAGDDRRAVYLTGSHVNNNFGDGSGPGANCGETPEPNDFRGYLGFLKERGHNFIRLWRWEQFRSQVAGGAFHFCMTPQPWPRTGPGTAKDGKPKFDLSKFDPAYFDRLRDYVIAAGNEGIYVSVMLFEGFGLHLSLAPDNVEGHPFHAANNVNGIGISSINDYQVLPLDPRVQALQEAYIREVVDTVQDLPNVLYEVANESSGGGSVDPEFLGMIGLSEPPDWGDSTEWQYWVIELVKRYEAQMGYAKHPVGMTMQYPVPDQSKVNDVLFKSPADWISPGFDDVESPMQSSRWLTDPPANDGAKVIISDTDHYSPMKADALWAWKSFFRGHNPILYDLGIIAGANPTEPSSGSPSFASLEPARYAMGDTLRFAREMDLIAMEPRADLSSTGYALANPGEEYLVLQPLETHDPFAVSLEAGAYSARWQGVVGRETRDGGKVTVEDRGDTSFTAPFSQASPAVLHLKRIGN